MLFERINRDAHQRAQDRGQDYDDACAPDKAAVAAKNARELIRY